MATQKYIVQNGQSLMDVALQVYGNALQVADLAIDNGLSITSTLTAGQALNYNPDKATRPDVIAEYNRDGRVLASLNFKGISY